jgi:hypothetical protein
MKARHIGSLRLLVTAAATMYIGGCAAPGRPPLPICPGKASVGEALATLAARAQQAVPFRGNGQILLTYHEPDSSKPKRHNLPMSFLFNPPWETYIQGSIAADPKAVIMGSNKDGFWLTLRPKEMSSYYLGEWTEARNIEGLMMSPKVVLEAFGIIQDNEPNAGRWSLKNEGAFDILAERDGAGRLVKRVYVYACDYLVSKIEYFDSRQKVAAVAELGRYKPVAGSFRVPTRVVVSTIGPAKRTDSIDITLTSTNSWEVKPKQREVFFNAPDSNKFEHRYVLIDGRWVQEP